MIQTSRCSILFAGQNDCELFNGYGVSYQIMLDKLVRPDQIVALCGDFGSIFGSAGALALRLTPEEMAEALRTGTVNYTVPETVSLELTGKLVPPASGKDAALAFLAKAAGLSGKVLLAGGEGLNGLGAADCAAFFQMLSAGGCAAAIRTEEALAAPMTLDLSAVVPVVSNAEDLAQSALAAELSTQAVSAVFIGGCSSGRIEDIRKVAELVKGKRVSRAVRLLVAFATTEVYIQAANEGLLDILMDAGAIVMNQGCSACYAHSQGLVDGKDIVLSAGSRACPNCNGEGNVKTYLCGVSTAITSAIAGHVCPAEL